MRFTREKTEPGSPDGLSIRQSHAIALGFLAIGAGLRIWQYLANTSLWVDEIFLATNILNRPTWQLLTRPLDYGQVAPKGFLLVEKVLVILFGPSDFVLKLFPFLGSLIALIGFAFVVRQYLPGTSGLAALGLFASSRAFIIYSSQVKQYSTDITVSVILLWLATNFANKEVNLRRCTVAGVVGAAAVWFSQPGVLMLAGLSCALIVTRWREHPALKSDTIRRLLPVLSIWSVSAAAATLVSLRTITRQVRDFMHAYWAEGFPPTPAWRAIEIRWPYGELKNLLGGVGAASMGYPLASVYCLLILLGFLVFWRRLGVRTLLLLMPVAATVLAATARQYPFADRLILFLAPIFLLAIAAFVDCMPNRMGPWPSRLRWFIASAILVPAIFPILSYPPPYRNEDIKLTLAHVRANWRTGDIMYVYYGGDPAFQFYSSDYRFSHNDFVLGKCRRGDNLEYRRELDEFRGRSRVWILLTHAIPHYREREDILNYLNAIGVQQDYFEIKSHLSSQFPAEAFLYSLDDPVRLQQAAAESVPLSGPESIDPRTACENDPLIIVPPRQPVILER
jgi:Dolichyl-phosphate-mannose-protein mannosyltransferase